MKKTRTQPALATLASGEKDQLADWLRKADYLDVLERVGKPLSEGGFGLTIHIHASKSSLGRTNRQESPRH